MWGQNQSRPRTEGLVERKRLHVGSAWVWLRKAERQEEVGAVETVAWGKRRGRVWWMEVEGSMSRSGLLRRRRMLA